MSRDGPHALVTLHRIRPRIRTLHFLLRGHRQAPNSLATRSRLNKFLSRFAARVHLSEHFGRIKPHVDLLQLQLVVHPSYGNTLDVDGAAMGWDQNLIPLAEW